MTDVPPERGDSRNLRSVLYSSNYLDHMYAGMMLHDANGVLIDGNAAALNMFGITSDALGESQAITAQWSVVHEDGSPFPHDELPVEVALRTGEPSYNVVMGIDSPGEARRWMYTDTWPIVAHGKVEGVASIFDDYSSRWTERHILHLLSEVNRLAMFATSEVDCLQQLCNALVEDGHYALAWVGRASGEGRIDVVCEAGLKNYVFPGIVSWSEADEAGHGAIGTALRTSTTQVTNDMTHASRVAVWRERAAAAGLGAVLAIPFTPGGHRSVLAVYSRHPYAFVELTITGLEEVAAAVEFGIAHLESLSQLETALEGSIAAANAQLEEAKARADAEQRFRLAFEENMAPMIFTDLDDRVIAANDAFCQMLGCTPEEAMGHDSTQFSYPGDIGITEEAHRRLLSGEVNHLRYVKRYLHKDGRVIVVEVSRAAARDASDEIVYFVVSQRDITEERALTDQLSHQALHDPLTGLANRVLFEDRLAQAHSRVVRQGGLGAVLLLDLDDFKGVNDTHGHLVGDQLLTIIAHRLQEVTRSSDTLCRFGGDEFLYLAEGLCSMAEAEQVAARLLDVFHRPFVIAGRDLDQHASIGVVVWDATSADASEIVQHADIALYEAKREGKGHHVVFTSAMHQQAASHFALNQELRHALVTGELSMHYQPIIDLVTSRIVGFEALMRWRHPERGWVPPNVFIPLAEQSDLILELGDFALRQSVMAAKSWGDIVSPAAGPYVTVNMSSHQFHNPGLIATIEKILDSSGLDPQRLIIEITESVALVDISETFSVLEQLSQLGIGMALDDFGTGYSSLSYLANLRPRIIKIDQSFVSPVLESMRNDTLLEMIVSLGNRLNMTVLGEGIETTAQLGRLRHLECDLGQGYLFSPAVPGNEVAALLGPTPNRWE